MKTITIYPTSVKVPEGLMLEELLLIKDFSELLDKNITPEREIALIDRCQQHGINIHHVDMPDGRTGETLISRDAFKMILEAANQEEGAYAKYFNMPAPELPGMNATDFNEKIIPLFKAAQRFGIALKIKTCSDEDFRTMSAEEVERVGEAIKDNSKFSIKLAIE